jgi:hypothetical protein
MEKLDIPQIIRCPNCGESIETNRICSLCNARNKAMINLYPEIFQESVFDKLNPKLDEILQEIENLKIQLRDFRIKGLRLKLTKQ